jgi:endoglucanase
VLDGNPASDADVWMAYTLLEAGEAWKEPRYTALGASLAQRIVEEEVVHMPGLGPLLLPGSTGFRKDESIRLNASYLPLQVFIGLGQLHPDGPWAQIAERIPDLVRASAPRGFATDWVDLLVAGDFKPSALGSYDAIRVYLWAGMLDPSTPGRDAVLDAVPGMLQQLRAHGAPPAKISAEGLVTDPKGPVGFRAALLPYLSALGETKLEREQATRVRSELDEKTGLYGRPATYYDQNLMLFALGFSERHFWFDARGRLRTRWSSER